MTFIYLIRTSQNTALFLFRDTDAVFVIDRALSCSNTKGRSASGATRRSVLNHVQPSSLSLCRLLRAALNLIRNSQSASIRPIRIEQNRVISNAWIRTWRHFTLPLGVFSSSFEHIVIFLPCHFVPSYSYAFVSFSTTPKNLLGTLGSSNLNYRAHTIT